MSTTATLRPLLLALAATLGSACTGSIDGGTPVDPGLPPPLPGVVDYGLALRSAAIRLTGNLPTLSEVKELQAAKDDDARAAVLGKRVDAYLADPRFRATQIVLWRNIFRMGGKPSLDAAPAFAAMLVDQERPFTEVVTASKGTCAALDAKGAFVARDCPNGPQTAGVLSDAGVQAQFYSSMAFRRVRFVQETFLCAKFPAEVSGRQEAHPTGLYFSPWEFGSVTGKKNTPAALVDFQEDAKGDLCANCHATMNHVAPLLASFGEDGAYQAPKGDAYAVHTPVAGNPQTRLGDWLPKGEATAWRRGVPAADLAALGAAIAADPEFTACLATRVWNWALSRGDVVVDQTTLSKDVLTELTDDLRASNHNVKRLMRKVFTHPSFVRY